MNVRDELLARIQEAAQQVLGEEAPTLTEGTGLAESEIDSLDLVEIMMVLEDHYGVVIDGDLLTDVTDIGGIIDVLIELRVVEARG